jgi:hypothetical protein
MMTAVKKAIRGVAERLGYAILKKSDFVRIQESERELLAAATQNALRVQELERELLAAAAQNALRVQELEREFLAAAAQNALRVQELERELLAARTEIAANDYPRLKAERDFYSNQTVELQTHNRVLTETATQNALRVQELERELLAARTEIAANDYPRLKAERDFYSNQMVELQTHNRVLTETATKFARRLQGHLEVKEGLPALPSILFTSIPKSGTVFTGQMLSRGLGLELVRLTAGSFPRYLFDLPRLAQFCAGGMIATEHFDASPENLQLLEAFVDRWVVHIRDPRSVLLSWVHNLDRLHRERHNAPHHLLYVCPTPPKHYFGLSLSQKVDWNIEHFLPNVLSWTKTWIETHDAGHHKILLTTFSDIVSGEDEFLFRILDFYEISRERFSRPAIESNDDLHFRVGREDEWRDWFTPMQLAQIRVMIDGPLTERFGWPLE